MGCAAPQPVAAPSRRRRVDSRDSAPRQTNRRKTLPRAKSAGTLPPSWTSPEQHGELVAKSADLVAVAEAQQERIAERGEADGGREAHAGIVADAPADYRRGIVCGFVETETAGAAEAAVELQSRGEVLAAQTALAGRS